MKKFLALILAISMMAACLVGCGGTGTQGDTGYAGGDPVVNGGPAFAEPTEIDLCISSHVSWPYNENWVIWDYIEEASNAQLNIQAIPSSDLATKLPLMMAAPENLPDLMHTWGKDQVDDYALSGAYIAISDNEHRMPNYTAYWSNIPEAEKTEQFVQRTSGDGKIYSTPTYGTHTVNNMRGWMYRKDIFEKHGLQVPTTNTELYEVAKKLKELYPDSYPICFRNGIGKLLEWGPSWSPDYSYEAYYNYDEGEWRLGAQEDISRDMIEFFIKLREENLVAPDFTTMPTKSWEELMSTDRGFITLDYIVRIDFFNVPNRAVNPEYTLAMMPPPKPDVATGDQKLMKSNLDFYGFCVCNTGDEQGVDNAFRLIDWMYTPDAIELLSWGKEGETFEVGEDGRRQFILTGDEQPQNKFGIGTYGVYTVKTAEANEALYTVEQVDACHELLGYLEEKSNPTMWMPYTTEQRNALTNLKQDISNYIVENFDKFILGQQPLNDETWATFQDGLIEMGAEELLSIYDEAYKNVMSNN